MRAAAEELRKQGMKVSDAVGEALKSMEESDLVRAVRFFHVLPSSFLLTMVHIVFYDTYR